jgi:hypothetical protein
MHIKSESLNFSKSHSIGREQMSFSVTSPIDTIGGLMEICKMEFYRVTLMP